jgi:hypothetical protein
MAVALPIGEHRLAQPVMAVELAQHGTDLLAGVGRARAWAKSGSGSSLRERVWQAANSDRSSGNWL